MLNETKLPPQDKAVWQTRYGRLVGDEETRQIKENLTGFFDLLAKWDRQKREADAKEVQP